MITTMYFQATIHAETGYYAAEEVKVPVPTSEGGEMVGWSEIAGVFLRSDGIPVMFVSTKSLGDENPLDWIHLIPTAVSYTTMSDWDKAPSVKEEIRKLGHLLTAETFEAPYAGLGSLFKFGDNESALGGFTAKELTESSAIHGDFDSASLNYSGKQNLEVRQAETKDGDITFNARQLIDKLYELDMRLYEEVLDGIAWKGYGRVGTWTGDDKGNMILLEDEDVEAEDKCKCNRGDYFLEPCWECYECGAHSSKDECWSCGHTTTTRGDWKDEGCWECTDCGEHYTHDYNTIPKPETFDAHARYNINRYAPKNNPRHNISGTRRKIKQQMWEDTTATVGVKGAAAIIAAVVVGIIAWKKK